MSKEMNKTQKDLALLGKINRVIKCMNAVYRQKDLQFLFSNMDSVLSEKAKDCRINFNSTVLNKYMPVDNINQIFTHTGSVIHVKVQQVVTDKKPGKVTIETKRWDTITIETALFDLNDKELKAHIRNHLLFMCAKKVEGCRGILRRQLELIDKMESMLDSDIDFHRLVFETDME